MIAIGRPHALYEEIGRCRLFAGTALGGPEGITEWNEALIGIGPHGGADQWEVALGAECGIRRASSPPPPDCLPYSGHVGYYPTEDAARAAEECKCGGIRRACAWWAEDRRKRQEGGGAA